MQDELLYPLVSVPPRTITLPKLSYDIPMVSSFLHLQHTQTARVHTSQRNSTSTARRPCPQKWKIFSAQIQSTVVVHLKKVDQKRRFPHSIVIKALNKQNKERILKTTRVNSQVDYKDKPKESHSTTQ